MSGSLRASRSGLLALLVLLRLCVLECFRLRGFVLVLRESWLCSISGECGALPWFPFRCSRLGARDMPSSLAGVETGWLAG